MSCQPGLAESFCAGSEWRHLQESRLKGSRRGYRLVCRWTCTSCFHRGGGRLCLQFGAEQFTCLPLERL